jgi:hypothetical protein
LVIVRRSWRGCEKRVGEGVRKGGVRLRLPPSERRQRHDPSCSARETDLDQGQVEPEALALGRERAVGLESLLHERKVRRLEERGGRADRVGRVGDDDVERVLDRRQVLEAVGNLDRHPRVRQDVGHPGQELLRHPRDGLVNVDEDDLLDRGVLEHLADDTAVAAADDEHLLRVRVRGHRDVGDHLLVAAAAGRREREGQKAGEVRTTVEVDSQREEGGAAREGRP